MLMARTSVERDLPKSFFTLITVAFPGMQVYGITNISQWTQNGGTFTIQISGGCCEPELYSGTYWVEIQANMTGMCCGEWGWTDRTVTAVDAAVWQNPSGSFGVCQSWSRRGLLAVWTLQRRIRFTELAGM